VTRAAWHFSIAQTPPLQQFIAIANLQAEQCGLTLVVDLTTLGPSDGKLGEPQYFRKAG
jgi:hypothetical protein